MAKEPRSFRITIRSNAVVLRNGTAWVTSEGWVVTSFHCVSLDKANWWFHSDTQRQCLLHYPGAEPYPLEHHHHDPDADVAILRAIHEEHRSTLQAHGLELAEGSDDVPMNPWTAPCYPAAGNYILYDLQGREASSSSVRGPKQYWQLTPSAKPQAYPDSSDDGIWAGASGAPILTKDQRVTGVITSEQTSLDTIWGACVTAVRRLLVTPSPVAPSDISQWLSTHKKIGIIIDDRQPDKARRRLARNLYALPVLPSWWYQCPNPKEPHIVCVATAIPVLEALHRELALHPDYQAVIVVDRYLPAVKNGQVRAWDDDGVGDEQEKSLCRALNSVLLALHEYPGRCFFRYMTSHPELSFQGSLASEEKPKRETEHKRWKTRSLEAMRTLREELRAAHGQDGIPKLLRFHSSQKTEAILKALVESVSSPQNWNAPKWALWTGIHAYTDRAYPRDPNFEEVGPQNPAGSRERDQSEKIYEIEKYFKEQVLNPESGARDAQAHRARFAEWKRRSRDYWSARHERVSCTVAVLMDIQWTFAVNTSSAPDISQATTRLRPSFHEEKQINTVDEMYFTPFENLINRKYIGDMHELLSYLTNEVETFLRILAATVDGDNADRAWTLFIVGENADSPWVDVLINELPNKDAFKICWVSETPPPDPATAGRGFDDKTSNRWKGHCQWLNAAPLEFAHDLWHLLRIQAPHTLNKMIR
jgi:hypothetical protein